MNFRVLLSVLLIILYSFQLQAIGREQIGGFLSFMRIIMPPAVRLSVSAVSGVVGAPGDIVDASLGLGNLACRYVPYMPDIPTYEQVQQRLPLSLPTSDQVKGGIATLLPEGALEPQSRVERCADFVVTEVAGSLVGKVSFVGRFMGIRKFLVPLGPSSLFSTLASRLSKRAAVMFISKGLGKFRYKFFRSARVQRPGSDNSGPVGSKG